MERNKYYHQIFANHLISEMENKLSWKNEEIILGKEPDNEIFLGSFSEKDVEQEKNGIMYPNHIGLQVEIDTKRLIKETLIEIDFECDFYYRISPTYNEQIQHMIQFINSESGEVNDDKSIDYHINLALNKFIALSKKMSANLSNVSLSEFLDCVSKIDKNLTFSDYVKQVKKLIKSEYYDTLSNAIDVFMNKELDQVNLTPSNQELVFKYKKFRVYSYPTLKLCSSEFKEPLNIHLQIDKYQAEFDRVLRSEIEQIKDILRVGKKARVKDILSESNFQNYINSSDIEMQLPNWKVAINVEANISDNQILLDIIFSNENNQNKDSKSKIVYPYSTKVYNAKISCKALRSDFSGSYPAFNRIDITDLAESYRYYVEKYGNSTNSGLHYFYDGKFDTLETTNFTIFSESRRKTREYETVTLRFLDYVSNPIKNLEQILTVLIKEKEMVYFDIQKLKTDKHFYDKAYEDFLKLDNEIKRFSFGIECIKMYGIVSKAFIHLNESFALESKKYDSWRLFQLVFIVSNIPDMIVSEFGSEELSAIQSYKVEDMVDILYFSTGGGKTEAFLGCVLFSMFFDRLRGKDRGLTAIIKYPLRLLSIQQVDRTLKKIASAQIIKDKHHIKGDDFSLGYFVGSGNTPNSVDYSDIMNDFDNFIAENQQVTVCPICNSKVHMKVENDYILHYCTVEKCKYHNHIPYLFIDDELYRKVPTVLISTLDKFAIMSHNDRFRQLLGITEEGKCDFYDPVPTLSITDEIHLIKESLGTFSSHYESFFYYYCSDLIKDFGAKPKKIKYLGATATISNYKYQVKELYMKDAHLFPAISPDIKQDFYSYVDDEDTSRINIAIMPFGVSPVEYILQLMKIQREVVGHYIEFPNELSKLFNNELNPEEIKNILYDYYIMIQYSNTKRDASRIRNGVDAYINSYFRGNDVYALSTDTILTGDTKFEHVKTLLSDIANSNDPIKDKIPNFITATSMISHGVDNDKFNSIYFFGVPNLFAEYIQAYSRVGRKYTGLIFNVIRPIRVREESFLSNFKEFMAYKELMITPIPIARYSMGALRKTLNGILFALLRMYAIPKSQQTKHLNTPNDLKNLLIELKEKPLSRIIKLIYSHDENEGTDFNQRINTYIKESLVFMYNLDKNERNFQRVVRNFNSTHEQPMRSLRDTDKPVIIELKGAYDE